MCLRSTISVNLVFSVEAEMAGVEGEANVGKVMKKSRSKKGSNENLARLCEQAIDNGEVTVKGKGCKKKGGCKVDGETYACGPCRNGHRVNSCQHAKERPMKATNPPGRPAAGLTKKIECDCPKSCGCATGDKSCKCPNPDCSCTDTMWMLVFVPFNQDPASPGGVDPHDGIWKKDYQVKTDLKGNRLTDQEVQEREERKRRQLEQAAKEHHSRNNSLASVPGNLFPPMPAASGGCCSHQEAVAKEQRGEAMFEQGRMPAHPVAANNGIMHHPAATHGCNCGAACACAFCPQHPNNQTSRQYVHEQAAFIHGQQRALNTQFTQFNSGTLQDMSCMGGAPQFAFSTRPRAYDFGNFETAFPASANRGFVMAYPMRQRTPTPRLLFDADSHLATYPPPSVHSQVTSDFNDLAMPDNMDWEQFSMSTNDFELGDPAMVVNSGPNGWQEHFQPAHDAFGLPPLSTNPQFDLDTALPEMPTPADFDMTGIATTDVDGMTLPFQAHEPIVSPMSMASMSFAPTTPFGTEFSFVEDQGFIPPSHFQEGPNTHNDFTNGL